MIYVTLTTIPSRLNSRYTYDIKECLYSLLNQTHNNYEIHLNLPSKLKHTGEEYNIPDWLIKLEQENEKLKVFTGLEDLGPVTKLYYTVQRVTNPEDIIIVVDDDLVYDERLVTEQISNQKKFVGAVVGYDGITSVDNFQRDVRDYFCSGINENNKVKVLQHYKSISYKRKYFEEDFNDFIKDNLSWNDDLLISAYFATKHRDKIATYHIDDPIFTTEDNWRNTVGTTFPLKGHTQHERAEGCNVYREANVDSRHDELYRIIEKGYYSEKYNRLQTVIYTNNNSLPIAEVAFNEFKEHAPSDSKVTIVTNQAPESFTLKYPENTYIANVENKRGYQFAEVMLNYLHSIDNEFIFFLLDDYITLKKFSRHDFNRILNLMSSESVDYFSFDRKQEYMTRQFKSYNTPYFDSEYINIISSDDLHRFSVQPCIWRRTSLISLLEKYPNVDVHKFETDKTIVQEDLKTLGFNWHVFDPKIPSTEGLEHHFTFSWAEVVRSGCFLCPENGFPRSTEEIAVQLIYKLVDKYSMKEKVEFENVLYKLKNT